MCLELQIVDLSPLKQVEKIGRGTEAAVIKCFMGNIPNPLAVKMYLNIHSLSVSQFSEDRILANIPNIHILFSLFTNFTQNQLAK